MVTITLITASRKTDTRTHFRSAIAAGAWLQNWELQLQMVPEAENQVELAVQVLSSMSPQSRTTTLEASASAKPSNFRLVQL